MPRPWESWEEEFLRRQKEHAEKAAYRGKSRNRASAGAGPGTLKEVGQFVGVALLAVIWAASLHYCSKKTERPVVVEQVETEPPCNPGPDCAPIRSTDRANPVPVEQASAPEQRDVPFDQERLIRAVTRSDDASTHLIVFGGAAQKLIRTGRCTMAEFEAQGGWVRSVSRDTGWYFIYCGGYDHNNRIYFHVDREVLEVEEARRVGEPEEPLPRELPDEGRPVGSGISVRSRPMSFEKCLQVIDGTSAEVEAAPVTIVSTSQLKTVKWSTGYGDVMLTCSKPDGKMIYYTLP